MAVNKVPVLKRCRSLGLEPSYLGYDKKSNRELKRANKKVSEYGLQLREKMCIRDSYVTVALALIEAIAMAIGFSRSGYLTDKGWLTIIQVIVTLTAGSAVLMWIGERITEKGVGNGISIVLVINRCV